jgi:hypothetical protein
VPFSRTRLRADHHSSYGSGAVLALARRRSQYTTRPAKLSGIAAPTAHRPHAFPLVPFAPFVGVEPFEALVDTEPSEGVAA